MAERRFSSRIVIAREPAAVFEWIADYRHVRQVLEGVSRWDPLGEQTRGRGARFSVMMSALGFPLENVLVLDQWDEPRAIGWRSESGLIRQSGEWRFRPSGPNTEVELTIGYDPPGGPLVDVFAVQVDAVVRRRLENALERTRSAIERST